MKEKWNKIKTTFWFRVFKELFFWTAIIGGYEILSDMFTAKDTMLNYLGLFFYIIWLTVIVNKLYNYYKQLKSKHQ